jgi:hypothetical protein
MGGRVLQFPFILPVSLKTCLIGMIERSEEGKHRDTEKKMERRDDDFPFCVC